ncbi:hypothetical protein M501DRAFT_1028537 [Patellaria atrata CBS 101060]|uniref:RING-type domain-containing protein n=1 Tax=Patellaria atrata CBS 101060 TaxID=1346257 RepID=A0A9P4SJJ8_9PEZI|nr:hypothetical protein M501DRAFT_1028537 [Patellaria atrata CBS 101060]
MTTQDQTPTLSREAFLEQLFPRVELTTLDVEDRSCCICREDYSYEKADYAVHLPCGNGHVFGNDCIRHWLNVNDSCPTCRTQLFVEGKYDFEKEIGLGSQRIQPNTDIIGNDLGELLSEPNVRVISGFAHAGRYTWSPVSIFRHVATEDGLVILSGYRGDANMGLGATPGEGLPGIMFHVVGHSELDDGRHQVVFSSILEVEDEEPEEMEQNTAPVPGTVFPTDSGSEIQFVPEYYDSNAMEGIQSQGDTLLNQSEQRIVMIAAAALHSIRSYSGIPSPGAPVWLNRGGIEFREWVEAFLEAIQAGAPQIQALHYWTSSDALLELEVDALYRFYLGLADSQIDTGDLALYEQELAYLVERIHAVRTGQVVTSSRDIIAIAWDAGREYREQTQYLGKIILSVWHNVQD